MKKYLLLLAIILPFVLTSCGDDKDEPKQSLENQLIGRWVCFPESGVELYYTFNEDHTATYKVLQNGVLVGESNLSWSLKGNVLTTTNISPSTEGVTYEISIDGDVLIMKDNTMTLEYHRAKG